MGQWARGAKSNSLYRGTAVKRILEVGWGKWEGVAEWVGQKEK